MEYNELLFRAA
jgi:hypothetical protein